MTSPHSFPAILPRLRWRVRHVAALSAAAAAALASPSAALTPDWGGLNADRDIVYFSSDFALAPGDTNSAPDLYASDGGAPVLITSGTAVGVTSFKHASADGSIVYVQTAQPIAPDDSGETTDLYVRTPTGFQRITPAAAADSALSIKAITPDGSRAWISTDAQLVASDSDTATDIYEYRPASKDLVLLSHGTTHPVHFGGGSLDGTSVWLRTTQSLEPNDTDGKVDVYRLKNGAYLRLTPGIGAHDVQLDKVGRASGTLLFTTTESLVAADTDANPDIYRRTGVGPVELVTASNAGAASKMATFAAADSEGGRVVFHTAEPMVPADTDTVVDVYAAENGTVTLLSSGPGSAVVHFEAASDDAQTVLMITASKLLPSDTDVTYDLYRYSNVSKTLSHINPTNNDFNTLKAMIAPAAGVVAWETDEPLAATDTDGFKDIYIHSAAGGIQHVSRRAVGSPPGGPSGVEMYLHSVLPDGRVLFSTTDRLTTTDRNDATDMYTFAAGTLTHLSRDVSPPDTTVQAPSSAAEGEKVQVQTGSTEQGTVECRVDTGDWFPCAAGANTIGPLAGGTHTVQARATDVAGNVDPTPATTTVVVPSAAVASAAPAGAGTTGSGSVTDAVAPRLSGGKLRLQRGAPTLSLAASEAASVRVRLQRRVDGRWRTVRSVTQGVPAGPSRIKLARRVAGGKHRALVVATDAARNSSGVLKVALRR